MSSDDPYEQLSAAQRTCLIYVARGLTSKEIARETGYTFRTVEQYVHQAQRILGASNRREAARLFAARAHSEGLNKLQLNSAGVANLPESGTFESSTDHRGWRWLRWQAGRLLKLGGSEHDLKLAEKAGAAAIVAFFGIVVVTTIGLIILGVNMTFPHAEIQRTSRQHTP